MRSAALAATLLLAAAASSAQGPSAVQDPLAAREPDAIPAELSPAQAVPFPAPVLVDRVVAVVDEAAILLSEIEDLIGLRLVERRPGESDAELIERVVDAVIEQRLRFLAVDRSGFERVPVAEIEARVAEIAADFPSPEAFRRRLDELGMTEAEVRQLAARQIAVLSYVEERLGARVFVGLDDIRAYYGETLVPQLEARGEPAPPLDEVREAIRAVLHEQRLAEEIERWTEELRREADVLVFPEPPETLPPVIGTVP
jgi:hypothetical protein